MAEEGLALYRRWRPKRFAEVVGQDLVVATLKRAVAQGRLHHAYLFAGQRGVGKTTIARILARAANCLAPEEGEPCNRCQNCLRILDGRSLDVVEIDGASHRGIDQVRQLREEVAFLPAGARYKVYIIDEVHMLTQEAFNALLKTLEEPPGHVIFMFATTEPHKVPATVLSRCQAFWLQPIAEELIAQKVGEVAAQEKIEISPEAATLLARRAGGSLRDALVLLEQLSQMGPITPASLEEHLGLPPLSQLDQFLEALLEKDADGALALVGELSQRGQDLLLFAEEALVRARDRAVAGETGLLPLLSRLLELRAELPRAFSRRLHLELFVLELCGSPKRPVKARDLPQAQPADPAQLNRDSPDQDNLSPKREAGDPSGAGQTKEEIEVAESTEDGAAGQSRRGEGDETWGKLVEEAWTRRADLGVFLSTAQPSFSDGVLHLAFPEEHGFAWECLQDQKMRGLVEELARLFYDPLLALEVHWLGEGAKRALNLEEAAQLLAQALEGEIIWEAKNGNRRS